MSTPKKISIKAWAALHYDPPPSPYVLRKWCRNGELYPAPEKVGHDWMIPATASRRTGSEPARGGLVAQLQARASA